MMEVTPMIHPWCGGSGRSCTVSAMRTRGNCYSLLLAVIECLSVDLANLNSSSPGMDQILIG
ncbi:hypothetical protein J6590_104254, partial [Homalodisca vitripennis]